MNIDILDSLNSAFGGPLVKQASSVIDEPENETRSALRSTFPTLLASLMQKNSTASGAADTYRYATSDAADAGIAGQLPSILGNRGSLDSLLSNGEHLTGALLGNRSGGVANAIAQVAGIRPGSATALLSMAAPLLFGLLKKQVTQGGLNANGLSNLLFSQRGSLERAGLDNRISSALGIGSLSKLLGSLPTATNERYTETTAVPHAVARAAPEEKKHWWPWALAAGVAALAVWGLTSRNVDRTHAEAPMASRAVPAEPPAEIPAPVAQTPAQTPESTPAETAAPERTRLASLPAKVYFEIDQASLGPQGQQEVAAVAGTVMEEGGSVAITGYTDRTGNPDHNLELAKQRANAVKDELVAEGMKETDIIMKPPSFVTGSGSDAEARRVEIAPTP